MRSILLALVMLAACGAVTSPPAQAPADLEPGLAAIEQRTGGRLGVALSSANGDVLVAHRAAERFAMCSTFKLPLAAMVLDSGISLRTPIAIGRDDLLSHSPYAQQMVEAGSEMRMGFAAQAIVEQSDNAAANLLLRRFGGPRPSPAGFGMSAMPSRDSTGSSSSSTRICRAIRATRRVRRRWPGPPEGSSLATC